MRGVQRTIVAQQGVDFSDDFQQEFGSARLRGACEFAPVLKAPEGVSTVGGQLARQHITLNASVVSQPAITAGWVDLPRKQSLLRTYDRLCEIQQERYPGRPLALDRMSYQEFFEKVRVFLRASGLGPIIEGRIDQSGARGSGGRIWLWLALVILVLGAAALLVSRFAAQP